MKTLSWEKGLATIWGQLEELLNSVGIAKLLSSIHLIVAKLKKRQQLRFSEWVVDASVPEV